MSNNSLLTTKERIILETINVIHVFGIHSLSTKEVAKRVGISEPAIFKHFKSKSDLILAVLDHFTLYDADVIQSIRAKKLSPVAAIRCYIDTFSSYYNNYPAITALTQNYDLLHYDIIFREKVRYIMYSRSGFIAEMVERAKKEGEIRENVDSQYLSIVIIGSLREWCLQWRISNYSFSINERMVATLDMLLLSLT
jgi:AcrR family transcriptional regulator